MDYTHRNGSSNGSSPAGAPSKSLLKFLWLARALLVIACIALASGQARGHDTAARLQDDGAPPPMRYLPEEARAKLSAVRDLKSRTRLSLELAEERIALVEGHVTADRFEEATRELGIYEALIKDAINHVQGSGPVDNKRRDQYKRIELALRAHVPRIEGIRRNLPSQNAVYARATLDFIRGLRTEALNAFYDDTVLRELPQPMKEPQKQPQAGERATGAPTQPAPENEKKPEH